MYVTAYKEVRGQLMEVGLLFNYMVLRVKVKSLGLEQVPSHWPINKTILKTTVKVYILELLDLSVLIFKISPTSYVLSFA